MRQRGRGGDSTPRQQAQAEPHLPRAQGVLREEEGEAPPFLSCTTPAPRIACRSSLSNYRSRIPPLLSTLSTLSSLLSNLSYPSSLHMPSSPFASQLSTKMSSSPRCATRLEGERTKFLSLPSDLSCVQRSDYNPSSQRVNSPRVQKGPSERSSLSPAYAGAAPTCSSLYTGSSRKLRDSPYSAEHLRAERSKFLSLPSDLACVQRAYSRDAFAASMQSQQAKPSTRASASLAQIYSRLPSTGSRELKPNSLWTSPQHSRRLPFQVVER